MCARVCVSSWCVDVRTDTCAAAQVGVGPKAEESALAQAVVVNDRLEVVYARYVAPQEAVTGVCCVCVGACHVECCFLIMRVSQTIARM